MKRSLAIALFAVLIIVILSVSLIYQNYSNRPTRDSITIGHVPMESFTLLYIAENQHYFEQNNLDVSIVDYPTGPLAVEALLRGEVDVAGSSDYAVAKNAVEQENITIFTAMGNSELIDLVARNGSGLTAPSDLKGKTIGVALDTVAEFNLAKFLVSYGLVMDDVNVVNVVPSDYVDSVVNGSVDALVSWEPYTDQIAMQLQGNCISWSLNSDVTTYSVLSCRSRLIETHTDQVNRLILALSEAQDYLETHSEQAQQVIKDRFNYTDSYLSVVWSRTHFDLSLTQSMIATMQDEAIWLINNNLTEQKVAPTIRDYIYFDCLRQVKPEAIEK
jgi:ABC-type nitrate/sulfonate/bicarbonate transport system substrate-binding protein